VLYFKKTDYIPYSTTLGEVQCHHSEPSSDNFFAIGNLEREHVQCGQVSVTGYSRHDQSLAVPAVKFSTRQVNERTKKNGVGLQTCFLRQQGHMTGT